MQGTTIKLASFIGLSMVAHGLLLFINGQFETQPNYTPIGSQVLSVTLALNNSSASDTSQDLNPDYIVESKTNKNEIDKFQPTPDTSPGITPVEINIAINQHDPAPKPGNTSSREKAIVLNKNIASQTAPGETSVKSIQVIQENIKRTEQRNFLLGEIQNRLSKYMNYPVRARRRGWEGSVMIGFSVDKQGFLRNVHLTQTSGYSLLDNAALLAIKKVNNIPVSQWGNLFQPVALQLPVIYRLTNS